MDPYEYENYMPKDIVRVFNPEFFESKGIEKAYVKQSLCYTHKFDSIDLNELILRCWKKGILAWYVFGNNSYMSNNEDIYYIIKE